MENKEINLFEYILIFVKHKVFLLGTTFVFMVIFYLMIYFFVDEQFDSTATIIPAQDQSLGGIASMLGDLGGSLPFGIGTSANPEIGLYNTILNSRTLADSAIEKFNFYQVYGFNPNILKDVKKSRESFQDNLNMEETEDGAFVIGFRSPDTSLSAGVVNFLIEYLNNKIIELKIKKSKENRLFLGERISNIKNRLTDSEDSLKNYQIENSILIPDEQIRGMISTFSILEKELLTKQLQKDVLNELYGENSPQVKNIHVEVNEFEKKIKSLKQNGRKNSIFLPFKEVPQKALEYLRLYREVEINSSILQFILPLYEQSKIEEQKDTPVIQIIDYAQLAEEKSFPPRSLLTLLFGSSVFFILFLYLIIKQNPNIRTSKELEYIKNNMFKLKSDF
jgi:uncharacterized protein involved in exopolysaccharide biosynthesis